MPQSEAPASRSCGRQHKLGGVILRILGLGIRRQLAKSEALRILKIGAMNSKDELGTLFETESEEGRMTT